MSIVQGRGHDIFLQQRRKGNYNPFTGVKNSQLLLISGFSPGQGLMLHMIISTAFPSHGRPPYWADGLLQVLVLVWLPRPQLLVHSSQGLHSDQLPSTIQRWNITLSDTLQFKALTLRQSIVREQRWISVEHVPICWLKSIPGHSLRWQFCISESDPWQGFPPLAGKGLLQRRLLFWMPFPQVTLQALHVDHWEYPPWTANKTLYFVSVFVNNKT